jgi:hypothetical protein
MNNFSAGYTSDFIMHSNMYVKSFFSITLYHLIIRRCDRAYFHSTVNLFSDRRLFSSSQYFNF